MISYLWFPFYYVYREFTFLNLLGNEMVSQIIEMGYPGARHNSAQELQDAGVSVPQRGEELYSDP